MSTPGSRVRRTPQRKQTVETHDTVVTVLASGVGIEDRDDRETIEVRQFATEPAYVRVSSGVTKQTAPYEALRVDVAISVPCYDEEIPAVTDRVSEMVAVRLDKEIDAYLGGE